MRKGLAISAVGHAALLTWALVSFSGRTFISTGESLPVDVVSTTEFTQIMNGQRNAQQAEKPKPLVEKIAPTKPAEEPTAKVSEKKEIAPTKTAAPPPPAPEAKPEPKPERAKKESTQPDPIAEALKKDEAKKPVKAEAKPAPKKPTQDYVFDPNKTAALLDKRTPQRHAAAGDIMNSTATLGLASGNAATLTESEIDALARQIRRCWTVPVGAVNAKDLSVDIRLQLKPDGTLAAEPTVKTRGTGSFFQIYAESGVRAIRLCQPYRMPIARYELWKDLDVGFTPSDM